MSVEYLVKISDRPRSARIYAGGNEVAEIRALEDLTYVLTTKDGNEWDLTRRVDGEIRPFSMTAKQVKALNVHDVSGGTTVLTVRNHVFLHNGKFYMLGGTPEGRPVGEFLVGRKYICRLDNFPFSDLAEIDHETMSRLRRFRGVPVGDMGGLGKEGHRVNLSAELEGIGLPLAASCYLLYSTA